MAKGLPKSIVKKYGVTKEAWKIYKAQQKGKVYKKPKAKTTKRKKTMSRKKRRRKRTKTIPLAPVIGFVAPLLAAKYGGTGIIDHIKAGDWANAGKDACVLTTGYDPVAGNFDISRASATQGLLIGLLVHKVVGWLGGNRIFSNLPPPLNKIRI